MKVQVTGDSMKWKKAYSGDERRSLGKVCYHMELKTIKVEYLRTWEEDMKKGVDATEKWHLKLLCPRQGM